MTPFSENDSNLKPNYPGKAKAYTILFTVLRIYQEGKPETLDCFQ